MLNSATFAPTPTATTSTTAAAKPGLLSQAAAA